MTTAIRVFGVGLLICGAVFLAVTGSTTSIFVALFASLLCQFRPPIPKWVRLASLGAVIIFVIGALIHYHRSGATAFFWICIALLAACIAALAIVATKPNRAA